MTNDDAKAPPFRSALDGQIAASTQVLRTLMGQIADARAELRNLRLELASAQALMNSTQAAELLEANEQLLHAALRARDAADTARGDLDEMAETSGRDALTGLVTRSRLLDRLDAAVAMARRHGRPLAVLFIDLDDFKRVNDTRGHAAGDRILQRVACKLMECVRESDTASRFGGDEFVVMLTNVSNRADVALVTAKIQASLAVPDPVADAPDADEHRTISASIGIAMFPDDATEPAQLIVCADAAMYDAKRRGHGNIVFHEHVDGTSASG